MKQKLHINLIPTKKIAIYMKTNEINNIFKHNVLQNEHFFCKIWYQKYFLTYKDDI